MRGSRAMAWRPSPSYQLRIPGCGLGNLAPTSAPASSPVALPGRAGRRRGQSAVTKCDHCKGTETREVPQPVSHGTVSGREAMVSFSLQSGDTGGLAPLVLEGCAFWYPGWEELL